MLGCIRPTPHRDNTTSTDVITRTPSKRIWCPTGRRGQFGTVSRGSRESIYSRSVATHTKQQESGCSTTGIESNNSGREIEEKKNRMDYIERTSCSFFATLSSSCL